VDPEQFCASGVAGYIKDLASAAGMPPKCITGVERGEPDVGEL